MIYDQIPLTRLIGLATGISLKTQRAAEKELKLLDLTYAQFGTLTAIREKDGRTQAELAGRLESDSNTVMVICDSLQKKGLVERRSDPADRRVWRICLTPKGGRVIDDGREAVERLYTPLISALTDQEIATAVPVLEKLYGCLKEREE